MKVIDLLNKIAIGEEVPKKIMHKQAIYEFNEKVLCYENEFEFFPSIQEIELNDEVEIIEEEKEIEKLEVALLGQCDNWLVNPTTKTTKQDIELNPYIIENIRTNTLYFQRKINELIDEVNKLKEDKQ